MLSRILAHVLCRGLEVGLVVVMLAAGQWLATALH